MFTSTRRLVGGLSLVLLAAGCGDRSANRYVPSEDASRKALEAALTAWRNGQTSPGLIPDTTPAVQAVDSRWASGQRLESFEVLQEEPGDGGPRVYSVRLTMSGPGSPQTVRYVVVGITPLWVEREEDYQAPTGM
jgi:hypothetical protein